MHDVLVDNNGACTVYSPLSQVLPVWTLRQAEAFPLTCPWWQYRNKWFADLKWVTDLRFQLPKNEKACHLYVNHSVESGENRACIFCATVLHMYRSQSCQTNKSQWGLQAYVGCYRDLIKTSGIRLFPCLLHLKKTAYQSTILGTEFKSLAVIQIQVSAEKHVHINFIYKKVHHLQLICTFHVWVVWALG